MGKAYFTIEEARRALPRIKPMIRRLMELHVKLVMQENVTIDYEEPFEQYIQGIREAHHWHRTQSSYFTLLRRLADSGIYVKNPEIGLIDFYAWHRGREIFLCYQYPEDTVRYWHELEGGFVGRRSVSVLEEEEKIG